MDTSPLPHSQYSMRLWDGRGVKGMNYPFSLSHLSDILSCQKQILIMEQLHKTCGISDFHFPCGWEWISYQGIAPHYCTDEFQFHNLYHT